VRGGAKGKGKGVSGGVQMQTRCVMKSHKCRHADVVEAACDWVGGLV
jgi:hypothetical protein